MRSLEAAANSWRELHEYTLLGDLREATRIEGHSSAVASAGLRSTAWKACLLFETLDTSTWLKTLASSRSAYDSLRMHFLRDLENQEELSAGDGLADGEKDSSVRQDEELRAEIQQDVDRCMPENLYFRQPETQRMLLDILYVFCKLNPDVSYRQGMHELLAPILWVIERDAVDMGQSSKAHGEDVTVRTMYSSEHIEHDSFALFSQLMHSAKNFYEQTTHSGKENPMVLRSERIMHDMLSKADLELAQHLKTTGIVPQIFLLRWIRLLFGREFPFDDVLAMWDVIFAEDTSLEIVDYVCLAMLLRIRWDLLESDYNSAIALLLRYPQPEKDHPAQSFVLDALYLRDHLSPEGSGYLILKYTGRPLMPTDRPATPPALQRNITAISGANAAKAAAAAASGLRPQQALRQKSNIQSIMQSTAKDIYARGEALGIGKAVRNAVDEVHKRAQEIRETQAPSVPPRGPRGGHGALYGKVRSLENRNRQLSKLLEGAVNELWDYQKLVADREKQEDDGPSPALEQLSMAIAKAQFVQVYMADPALPLTEEDTGANSSKRPGSPASGASNTTPSARTADPPPYESTTQLVDPSAFDEESPSSSPLPDRPRTLAQEPSQMQPEPDAGQNVPTAAPVSSVGTSQRPLLAESSYSWMLGEQKERVDPFSKTHSPTPEPQRNRGVLFGEPEGGDAPAVQVKRATPKGRKQKVSATPVVSESALNHQDGRRDST